MNRLSGFTHAEILISPRRQIVYLALALIAVSIDVLLPLYEGAPIPGTFSQLLTVAICAALVACGWYPRSAGYLVLALTLIGYLTPEEQSVIAFVGNVFMVVAADWISRQWYLQAALGIVLLTLAAIYGTAMNGPTLPLLAIEIFLCVLVGTLIRLQRHRIDQLNDTVDRATQALARHRHELNVTLHDDVATELTRIAMVADGLKQDDLEPSVTKQATLIAASSRKALTSLRALMAGDGTPTGQRGESIDQVLDECRTLLRPSSLTLKAEIPPGFGQQLSEQHRILMANLLREGCINAMKYAKPGTSVTVATEATNDGVEVILTSRSRHGTVDKPTLEDNLISGGFGLGLLAQRAKRSGAVVNFGPAGPLWLLTMSIPTASGAPTSGTGEVAP